MGACIKSGSWLLGARAFFSKYMRWEKAPLVWGKRALIPFLQRVFLPTIYTRARQARDLTKKSGTHTFCSLFFLAQFVKRVEKGGKGNAPEGARKKNLVSAFEKPTVLPQRKRKKTNLPEKRGAKAKASSSLPPIHFPIISPSRKEGTISVGDPLPSLPPQRTSHHLFLFSRVVLICPPKLREPLHHNFFWVLFRGWKEKREIRVSVGGRRNLWPPTECEKVRFRTQDAPPPPSVQAVTSWNPSSSFSPAAKNGGERMSGKRKMKKRRGRRKEGKKRRRKRKKGEEKTPS